MNGKEFLFFTRRERNGIISLVLIVLAITFLPGYIYPKKEVVIQIDKEVMKHLLERKPSNYPKKYLMATPTDTLPQQKKSMRFTAESDQYARDSYHPATYAGRKPSIRYTQRKIEINSADTSAFIALPGIGSKLSARIVLFREKLGGFVRVEQLAEVYGIDDTVFRMIKPMLVCDSALVRKIPVNTADTEMLKTHPYIRWNLANALVNYRSHHGAFSSMKDLQQIENIEAGMLKKLEPYIAFR